MYKCDKCGCEHNSRTVCPKCGAPVVIVNEDYLLRRQQWEEQQRNNLRYKKKGEDRKTPSTSRKSSDEQQNEKDVAKTGIAEKLATVKTDFASKLRDRKSVKEEDKKKKEKEKNAEELKDNRREKRLRQRRNRIIAIAAVAAGIAVTAVAVTVGINIYRNIDRSDMRYFDGHELVSALDGVILSVDRADGSYSLLTYSDKLNAVLMSNGASLVGWYDKKEYSLPMDAGAITDEFMFSDSGRYLAYVLYSEADEKYTLMVCDMSDGSSAAYEDALRIKLVAVNDAGIALYDEIDTTDYSTVVGMNLYAADTKKKLLIASDVTGAVYDAANKNAAFIKNDCLYICNISPAVIEQYEGIISDREHILVNEEVLGIADNVLDNELLYITDAGLWIYEENYNGPAVSGIDMSAQVYYTGGKKLFYRTADKLYYAELDKKSSVEQEELSGLGAAKPKLIIEGIKGNIVVSEDNQLWCVTAEGILCRIDMEGKKDAGQPVQVDSNVIACGELAGESGCAYVKDGGLNVIYGKASDKTVILAENNVDTALANKIISSKKSFYFLDSSSVLWKIDKNGKDRESLGFTSLVGLYNQK